MKRIAIAALAAALTVVLASCGEKPEPAITASSTTTTTTTPNPRNLVVYERTGGIAGIHERLIVTTEGRATLLVGQPPNSSTAHFQLTSGELKQLHRLLAGAELKSAKPSGCADCFVYRITTQDGIITTFDESSVPPGAKDLVAQLEGIVADNIPAHASKN